MSKYKRFAGFIVIIQIVAIIAINFLYFREQVEDIHAIHRVEVQRVASDLEKKIPSQINLAKYETIKKVSIFNSKDSSNNDYAVEEVKGSLYRIEYERIGQNTDIYYINIGLISMLIFNVFLLLYVWRKILKPFNNMTDLTCQLAKGNLSSPLKAEKSKFLGKFIWSVDMLRENLEDSREKELQLHKEKKTLILSLSHDIKTPLSVIDMYTKALKDGLYQSQDKKVAALNGINKNVQDIKNYVDKIVLASREDFLNLEVENSEFYLEDLMQVVEVYYRDKLSSLQIDFIIEKADNCLLYGDMDRMVEVIQNIVENAIKYGDGKLIKIWISEEEDFKLINIENTGSNIREEELANIFDSFYRGSNCKNIEGSGLGLFIGKNLMSKMDGHIFAKIDNHKFCLSLVIKKL